MPVFQVVALGVVVAVLLVIIRQQRPEMAVLLSLAAGIVIFLFLAGQISILLGLLEDLARRGNVNLHYLSTILKIVGVAYLAQFGSEIARDAGEGAIAAKIEFAGKVTILILAVPIVTAVVEVVLQLLAP